MHYRNLAKKTLLSIPVIKQVFIYYHFHSQVNKALEGCESILDLGCGTSNSSSASATKKRYSVGVDAYLPSIEESKKNKTHDEYHHMNVLDIGSVFKEGQFDAVIALDLIEHLEKEDGEKLLEMMEYIAKKKVIIFTPNGYLPQGEYYNNPWQLHRSGWTANEMKKRGYGVTGFGGLKLLRPTFEVRFSPKKLWWFISDVSEIIVRNLPQSAFSILCVKEKNN